MYVSAAQRRNPSPCTCADADDDADAAVDVAYRARTSSSAVVDVKKVRARPSRVSIAYVRACVSCVYICVRVYARARMRAEISQRRLRSLPSSSSYFASTVVPIRLPRGS